MILATTKVKDLDNFLEVYGTKGADKRGSHGSKGSTVYRDPIEEDRVWAIFDWDVPEVDEALSDRLILKALRQSIDDIEAQASSGGPA